MEPVKFVELLLYCVKYSTTIFVRVEVFGRWKSVSLSELKFDEALAHINKWAIEDRMPHRVLEDEDVG